MGGGRLERPRLYKLEGRTVKAREAYHEVVIHPAPRRGVALILTLLVLAVLIAIVAQLAYTVSLDHRMAANQAADRQNQAALRSAVCMVLAQLDITAKINTDGGSSGEGEGEGEDEAPPAGEEEGEGEGEDKSYHTLVDPWAQEIEEELGDTKVKVVIVDEERKYDLHRLVPEEDEDSEAGVEELTALLTRVLPETAEVQADVLAQNIRDFLKERGGQSNDPNVEKLAESGLPMFSMDELAFVDGMTEEILYGKPKSDGTRQPGLIEFVTIYSNGKVNLNTAPGEVIEAILPKDVEDRQALAQKIVEARGVSPSYEEEPPEPAGEVKLFKSLDDLQEIEGMDQQVASTSSGEEAKAGEEEGSGEGDEPAEGEEEGGGESEEPKDEGEESGGGGEEGGAPAGGEGEGKQTVLAAIKSKTSVSSKNFGVTATVTSDQLSKRAYFVVERGEKESRVVYWKVSDR